MTALTTSICNVTDSTHIPTQLNFNYLLSIAMFPLIIVQDKKYSKMPLLANDNDLIDDHGSGLLFVFKFLPDSQLDS